MSFLCLEVVSKTSSYITFPGAQVRLQSPSSCSSWWQEWHLLFSSHWTLFPVTLIGQGLPRGALQSQLAAPLALLGPALLPSSSCPGQSLHRFIANSRYEFLQTLEAFKGTAVLQISVMFEGVDAFLSRQSSEATLQLLLEPEIDFSILLPLSNT